jgi:hypothetical protein
MKRNGVKVELPGNGSGTVDEYQEICIRIANTLEELITIVKSREKYAKTSKQ